MLTSIILSAIIGTVAGTASVVDADTLDIRGERVRLVGVDAPEAGQKCLDATVRFVRCGTIAANALDRWINRASVTCDIEGKDRNGACSAYAEFEARASRNGLC